jgi:hypothetical protein
MVTPRSIPSFDCIEFGQELFCLIHKDRFEELVPVPGTGNSSSQIRMKLKPHRGAIAWRCNRAAGLWRLSWTDFGTNLKCATIWGIT